MDFYERLSELLLKKLALKSALTGSNKKPYITFEPISDNEKGVALLDAPSTTNLRYLDKSKMYDYAVQVVVKNKNQQQAMLDAMAIYQLCDRNIEQNELKSKNDSFDFDASRGYTMPRMIEKTEHNAYIYSFLIKFDLYIKK